MLLIPRQCRRCVFTVFLKGQQSAGLKQLVSCYNERGNKRLLCFPINGDSIDVVEGPEAFYSKLKLMISKSSKRVILSSLYIGTDKLSKNLVNLLSNRLDQINDLRVRIVVDYNRGQRLNKRDDNNSSSKGLLQDLARKANISFFLSPAFGSYLNRYLLLPLQSINEGVSTQHIKCYIGDDDLILTGANLSEDYFTNRQDRYIYLRNCPELCEYLESVISLIGKFSFRLHSNGDLKVEDKNTFNPFETSKFVQTFTNKLDRIQSNYQKFDDKQIKTKETLIIPTMQMKYLQITDDSDLTKSLFNYSRLNNQTSHLVSGYFNLTYEYINLLIQSKSTSLLKVLAASEEVNGFYQGTGLKKYIPSIYTEKSRHFLAAVNKSSANVDFYIYRRKNWTFHAKGFWTYLNDGSSVTSIGSSNYGYRSVHRDLEMQFLVVTKNLNLIEKLENERNELWKFAEVIKDENSLPQVSKTIKLASNFLENYF